TAQGSIRLGASIAATAPTVTIILIGQIVQASGAAIMMRLMRSRLFLLFPVSRTATSLARFGLVISFARAIDPSLSGSLAQQFPWRTVFYVVLPIAIINILPAYFLLTNVTEQKKPKLDLFSIVLSTGGFGGLLSGFSTAGDKGWISSHVIIATVLGAVSLYW